MTQTPYIKNIRGFFCVVWTPARLAFGCPKGNMWLNHARLASTDLRRQAHFGGFFLSGVCA